MRVVPFLFAIALCSCANNAKSTQAPAAPPAAVESTAQPAIFGEAFEQNDPVPVALLGQDASPYLGKTVQITGKVSAVCQKAGCWMELTDESASVRVRVISKDHSFFVPKDSTGKQAVAQGVLSSLEVPQEEAAHFAEESGQPVPTGPVHELRLEMTGVIFIEG